VTGLILVATASAQAPDRQGALDSYDDPLAFTRIDEEARDLTIAVELRTTGEMRRASGRLLLRGSQEIYLRSAAVAVIFQATRLWQAPLQRLTVQVGGTAFAVSAGSRLVVSDQQEVLLPVPVLVAEGDLWLPVSFLTDVLGPGVRQTVRWDPEQRRLAVGSASYNVTGLRVERLTRATAVHIRGDQPLGYRVTATEPGHLILKIYGAEIDPSAVAMSRPRGLVSWVRSSQKKDHALVLIGIDDLVGRYRTYTRDEGREIVIVLEEEQVSALPEPIPRGRASIALDLEPIDVTRTVEIRTVVIDPGHGGGDVGAIGPSGVQEKDVNLAVARRLINYLEHESDLEVVLTRDDDTQKDLAARAEIANTADGDLFISLHCNSWFDSGASGFETFFLSPAETDWSRSVEAKENQADGETSDVEFIVWELVQNSFIASSSDLAEVVQLHVCDDLGLPNRGVRQAGFRVLVGAYMPAVLVEMGFVSHPEEERRLASGRYQERLAKALGDAILVYRERAARAAATADAGNAVDGTGPGGERR